MAHETEKGVKLPEYIERPKKISTKAKKKSPKKSAIKKKSPAKKSPKKSAIKKKSPAKKHQKRI
jgi:hypothetical protein